MAIRLLVQVVSWAVTILVARFLMPFDYGVLTSGSIFLGLCDLLSEAGVLDALVQKQDLDDRDLAEGFTFSLMLAAAMYAMLGGLAAPASTFFHNPELAGYLRVAGLLLLLIPFRTVSLGLLQRRLQMRYQASIHVVSAMIQAGLTLSLAAAGWRYWSLLAGSAVARLVEVGLLARWAAWTPRLRWPRIMGGSLIRFGVHSSAAGFLWFVYTNADFAVVGRLVGPVALGYYAFAFWLISMPVQKLTANINQIAYPVFCRLQHDPARLKDWYLRLIAIVGLVAMPAMAGMALVADDAIGVVLGMKWMPAVLPFRLLSLVGILMVFGSSLPPVILALGRPDLNMKYNLLCAIAYPLGFFLLGRQFGVTGVCAAWLVIYPVAFCFFTTLTRPITGIGLLDLFKSQSATLGSVLVMMATVVLARRSLGDSFSALPRLGICIAVGIFSFSTCIYMLAGKTIFKNLRELRSSLRGQ